MKRIVPKLAGHMKEKRVQEEEGGTTDICVKESVESAHLLSKLLHLHFIQAENSSKKDRERIHQQNSRVQEVTNQVEYIHNDNESSQDQIDPTHLRKGFVDVHIGDRLNCILHRGSTNERTWNEESTLSLRKQSSRYYTKEDSSQKRLLQKDYHS